MNVFVRRRRLNVFVRRRLNVFIRRRRLNVFVRRRRLNVFVRRRRLNVFVRIRLNVFVAVSVHERSCLDGAYVRKTGIQYHNLTKLCDREKVFRIELHCGCHRQAAELELIWE